MKTKILLFATLLGLSASQVWAQASKPQSVKSIVKANIRNLDPYTYDCYAAKEISYTSKEQSIIVEFSVYSEEDYKLLFCKTVLPQSIDIYIFDGYPGDPKSKLIYFDETGTKDPYVCNFRPAKTGAYFIQYKVPVASAPGQKGSMIVLIGVKDTEESLAKY